MSEQIQNSENGCIIKYLQSLYGRRYDSLSEEELNRLKASYLGKSVLGTTFGCSVEGCKSTFTMRLRDGELHSGDMIFLMEGKSSPCLYEQDS